MTSAKELDRPKPFIIKSPKVKSQQKADPRTPVVKIIYRYNIYVILRLPPGSLSALADGNIRVSNHTCNQLISDTETDLNKERPTRDEKPRSGRSQ